MNKVDLKKTKYIRVAYTNSDVQIVILLTSDKQADSLKYDAMSTFSF